MGIMNWNLEHIENFKLREARCHGWEPNSRNPNRIWHDCGLVILVPELCQCVYEVRKAFNKPIIVKSWTRCRIHNLAVGGVENSYHINGHAVDLAPAILDRAHIDRLYRMAAGIFPFTYPASWGLHADIRGKRPEVLGVAKGQQPLYPEAESYYRFIGPTWMIGNPEGER